MIKEQILAPRTIGRLIFARRDGVGPDLMNSPSDSIGDQIAAPHEAEPFDDTEDLRAFRGIALGVEVSLVLWLVLLIVAFETI
jgi:hypothetical protein